MSIFNKKKDWKKPFPQKIASRVAKIPTSELASWAEQSMFEINRCISAYQKTNEKFYIQEALMGAEAAHAVLDELYRRSVL